ncbi:MAG: hypothetical protein JO051_08715 [Acidobacteriaceae bacterium]|nr:hypothetical protein [Acidobacteriaceae bacterium]
MLIGCLAAAVIWAADVTGKWTADVQGRMTSVYKGKVDGDTIHFSMTMEGGENFGGGHARQFDAKRAGGM